MNVLLLSMPLGALERQALGISILKPAVRERGHDCDLKYLTFRFAELIGEDAYRWLSYELPYTAFAGDWCFTRALYGDDAARDAGYVESILRQEWRLGPEAVRRVLAIRDKVPLFMLHCLDAVPWQRYELVGFTSTFEQNIASLALAKLLKARYPDLTIVFGGANWEADMGLELHRRFPFVDYVCPGEADRTFPELVDRLARGRDPARARAPLPGLVFRRNGRSVYTGQAKPVMDLDTLPQPDFDDYFRDLGESTVGASVVPNILFESSRGCWWGEKSHCTFCGLNGGAMAFRRKSAGRTLAEIRRQLERHRVYMLEAVDNILDMRYFHDFVPALADAALGAQLFYEVKANLTRNQLRALAAAGVTRLQPGIESLSDHVLKLMRKGTTGLRNVQFLKWCREYGIHADWNVLYGFPGETREDYVEQLGLLRRLSFLEPPSACGPIRLDRFSPYHEDPAGFGMRNVRPMKTFPFLYPFEPESLARIAYYFEFDYAPECDPRGHADEVIAFCEAWRARRETGELRAEREPDGTLRLTDTRAGAAWPEIRLAGLEQAAYEQCDEYHGAAAVARHLRERFPDVPFDDEAVRASLDSMVASGLMVTDRKAYLALALAGPRLRAELEGRERKAGPAAVPPAARAVARYAAAAPAAPG